MTVFEVKSLGLTQKLSQTLILRVLCVLPYGKPLARLCGSFLFITRRQHIFIQNWHQPTEVDFSYKPWNEIPRRLVAKRGFIRCRE